MNLSNTSKTAVLIFANSSKEELKHKRFIGKEFRLFDTLTSLTIKTVEKSALPYFHYSEREQVGGSFGERFTNAIQAVFNKGYDSVITIGNDTPTLKASHLIEAATQLKKNKFVLGPSLDGGFYLMGINKKQFNANLFHKLPWQTSTLRNKLLATIASSQETLISLLPILTDIDAIQDIKKLINDTSFLPQEIFLLLLSILKYSPARYTYALLRFFDNFTSGFFNKGSPVFQPIKWV